MPTNGNFALSRRALLRRSLAVATTAVGGSFAGPLSALEAEKINVSTESLERVAEVFTANPIVDFHTHIGIWQNRGLDNSGKGIPPVSPAKFASNIQEYLDAGVNCIYLDTVSDIARTRIGMPGNKDRDFQGDEAWEEYERQYALMMAFLDDFPMSPVTDADSLEAINARGELGVVLSTEGAHMLEVEPARLKLLYEQGLRRLQPIHYVASTLGDSQTDPERYGGLSPLGRQVLEQASDMGMLLDMAHASQKVVEQTVELVDRPLALSHTMIKYNSSRFGDYRNTRSRWISPEHARLIADTGGVVGTFPIQAPYGVSYLDEFVEALQVMVDTVGIDHVAWSTDLGEPVRPAFLQSYLQFPRLCAKLLESGFSDSDLAKFAGGNALRVQAAA
ncbi:dipeptidase [Congregibacter litoralis]|uniref:Zn-dependent dipeptidase, microsomal dipeptidase-like protein n=1 Tax=Congregibacter litoralis KT71 TaxID=314285 RepID=A4A9S1_9GAMM|nr:membrane dipeptidase [Congregibacter litoralis]EAQ97238.1 Zn-dependent dipeptidase, microsomal dipeptidase-like protein [Congregibacter litoralis KT71]